MAKQPRIKKVIDDRFAVRCALGKGTIRYEVWQDAKGKLIRYNLAFIYPQLYKGDNGRVLGYDTAHGYAHRHYFGQTEPFEMTYEEIVERFTAEVEELRQRRTP
jgi:hypothetical protein